MNEKELYEKQYGEKKLVNVNPSFPFLRSLFKNFDLNREDLALSLLDEGDKLLDVGCGSGSLIFKARPKFAELYGIDICLSRIEEAEQMAVEKFGDSNNVHFSVCNVNEKIDFPDNLFDVVASIAVVEHIFDPYHVIMEIHRVLKPGGVFVILVPNIAYIKHRIRLLLGKLPVTSSPYNWREIGWDGGHLHFFTKKTLCTMLHECGFRILEISGSGLFGNLRNFYPSLLTGDICVKAQER